jgi:acetyl-CoA carboxylase biotin carboxyl carrier protein
VNIDLKKLEALLKVLEERNISEFEFEEKGLRLHLKRGGAALLHPTLLGPYGAAAIYAGGHPAEALAAVNSVTETAAIKASEGNFAYVTSPFVGTFYRSPSPDAQPFVDVGSNIRPGQSLCIVEAMKLMNEIEAEFAGTIMECLAETGNPVEFGQKLFKVKKA